METLKKCIPWFDFSNPYKPFCNCAECQIEKNGLFSVPKDATCCLCIPSWLGRPFLGAIDVFMTPFILVLHYMRIYLLPAVMTTVMHLVERFLCALNCCKYGYTDWAYPPNDATVGSDTVKSHTVENLDMWHRGIFYAMCGCIAKNQVEWVRAKDLYDSDLNASGDAERIQLFKGDIDASDIYQGSLGDCWLLASLSAVAERHPELIRDAFLTGRTSLCGYYKVKIFDVINGTPQWRVYTIDDWIPVNKGTKNPMFSQPANNELWVLLMEKVFSKMLGNYKFLKGGFSRFPFAALTGNDPVEYILDNGVFRIMNSGMKRIGADYDIPPDDYAPAVLTMEQMYNVIEKGIKNDLIMTVGVLKGTGGLVGPHMYAITNACTHTPSGGKTVHLVQLRNPHGRGCEWNGAYSDDDRATHGWKPDSGFVLDTLGLAKKGVEENTERDGLFWIPVDVLARDAGPPIFCFCAVSDSMATTRLNMHEDIGECGPCYGALEGGCTFCCVPYCEGVQHLWCPQTRSTAEMIHAYSMGNSLGEALGCDKC